MKHGSLVQLINKSAPYQNIVSLEKVYTVEKVIKKLDHVFSCVCGFTIYAGEDGIILTEVRVPNTLISGHSFESFFPMKDFRELLPPIENIEEHINKEVLKPELV